MREAVSVVSKDTSSKVHVSPASQRGSARYKNFKIHHGESPSLDKLSSCLDCELRVDLSRYDPSPGLACSGGSRRFLRDLRGQELARSEFSEVCETGTFFVKSHTSSNFRRILYFGTNGTFCVLNYRDNLYSQNTYISIGLRVVNLKTRMKSHILTEISTNLGFQPSKAQRSPPPSSLPSAKLKHPRLQQSDSPYFSGLETPGNLGQMEENHNNTSSAQSDANNSPSTPAARSGSTSQDIRQKRTLSRTRTGCSTCKRRKIKVGYFF